MARRQFKVPFADTGDKASVPDAVQPDGSVSLQEGYGFDYQRDLQSDPLAKVFPRDVMNGLLNEITASIGEIQQQGYAIWAVAGAPYVINAVVRHNNQNWQSNIANNSDEPGVGSGAKSWKLSGKTLDYFNATIASIASSSSVNLTAGAPETSHVLISGTSPISSFVVQQGRAFVARFSGNCSLVNSSSLVTNRGSDISVFAGDSCIIRATADNTVEVVCGNFLIDRAIGSGQTYQSFTAPARSLGVTYSNTTGRTIFVVVCLGGGTGGETATVSVGGLQVYTGDPGYGTAFMASFAVPNNASYVVTSTTVVGYTSWVEVR